MLEPGNHVLVRILAFEGKHKLLNKWNEDIYVVESQPNPDIPVYILYREADGRSLVPIGCASDDELTHKVHPTTRRWPTSVDWFLDQERGHPMLQTRESNNPVPSYKL